MILLIDDDPEILRVLESCFENAGLLHRSAESGAEGVELARALHPQVILLDVRMPEMDGFETFERLRALPGLAATPILFLTAADSEQDVVRGYELGAEAYISKPFQPAAVMAKVRWVLTRQRQQSRRIPHSEDQLIGGDHRVIRCLGEGGMGIVYLVERQRDGAQLALKTLRQLDTTDDEALQMAFRRLGHEIEAISQLAHPNVIRLHEVVAIDARRFGYTMDYHAAPTLATRLASGTPLPPAEALTITAKLARGLHHAHSHGILHRDLKPDNVLFDVTEEPVLSDFGLVLRFQDDVERLTRAGFLVGTTHYMSPEQIVTPNKLGPRSDLFSLGLLLYEMLVGRTPFGALPDVEVMRRIVEQDVPPPSRMGVELPSAATAVLACALCRARAGRFQSGQHMAEVCEHALEQLD